MDRIYSPLVTLWVFLGQVLSADHSCRAAVARLLAHRISRGQSPCSPETGAYCQARKRIPEKFFSEVARQTGRTLETDGDPQWLWKGRRVHVFDGSTVSMPDTAENQQAYPQPPQQKPGIGFPLARIAAFFSLSCGAVVDLAICRYAGKGQSELGMLRTLWNTLLPGDIMLADRYLCAWHEIFLLRERGVDTVTRLRVHRSADFRRGRGFFFPAAFLRDLAGLLFSISLFLFPSFPSPVRWPFRPRRCCGRSRFSGSPRFPRRSRGVSGPDRSARSCTPSSARSPRGSVRRGPRSDA